jgi:hypothetical protein
MGRWVINYWVCIVPCASGVDVEAGSMCTLGEIWWPILRSGPLLLRSEGERGVLLEGHLSAACELSGRNVLGRGHDCRCNRMRGDCGVRYVGAHCGWNPA